MVLPLLVPAAASAQIKPGRAVGSVAVGMTKHQVKAKLGKPAKTGCLDRQGVGDCTTSQTQFSYRANKLIVTFVAGRVADIKTSQNSQKDSKGIGPGSTRAQVRKAYPKAKLDGYGSLFVPKIPSKRGQRYTTFQFFGGGGGKRVTAVVVGRYDERDFCVFGCG
jgi:hypothetical protein